MSCSGALDAWPPASAASPGLEVSLGRRSSPPQKGAPGDDAGKQGKGRKRHLLVETLGLILAVGVTAASVQAGEGAKPLLAILRHTYSRLRHIWAAGAYPGPLVDWGRALRPQRPIYLEIATRSDRAKGFVGSPKRWLVERTFGWFKRYRRLSQDSELVPAPREAIIQVPMIPLMRRRLARIAPY
jgi:transposase